MTEPLKRFKPNTKMVPVPSRSIIPERDVNHSPVLEASHLGIEFGGLKAVDDVNLAIGRTEICGLIGPNGAGKTTVFNLLTKVYQPTTGTVLINGKDTAGMNTVQASKLGIARTFQNIRLFDNMTVEENVRIGLHNQIKYGMFSGIFRLPQYWQGEKKQHEKALDLLSIFGMENMGDVKAGSLPYGAQRRLEIVRALATNPSLLLLDEPAAGMNPHETAELMENIVGVTGYLRNIVIERGGDPERECLRVFFTKDGKPYFRTENGECWRCYNFITGAHACQSIDDPKTFFNAAKAFGTFQCLLADYPSSTLHETIPNFHNTRSRFADFKKAVGDDLKGRAAGVQEEIDFVLSREGDTGILVDMLSNGELPLRVTHNDTKLNNVMFDNETDEGICVIDLDTVMPGLSLYDFGDSIRFGASTAAEDEKDLSKVNFDIELYKVYTEGYLSAAGKSLTDAEIEYLPFSSKLMTLECGMRFLGDYLNGDTYFRIDYPEHNLVRARTQFKLVEDMEKQMDEMKKVTQEIYEKVCK